LLPPEGGYENDRHLETMIFADAAPPSTIAIATPKRAQA
jgi:hypothetical protein